MSVSVAPVERRGLVEQDLDFCLLIRELDRQLARPREILQRAFVERAPAVEPLEFRCAAAAAAAAGGSVLKTVMCLACCSFDLMAALMAATSSAATAGAAAAAASAAATSGSTLTPFDDDWS